MENELLSIENKIYEIRGIKVMLDFDLAELYGIENRRLKEQVRRNRERFPEDFMFELTSEEYSLLRSQIATLENQGRGKHAKYPPFAFTENGVAMLSSVLKSPLAIQVNINIMRAFTRMRQLIVEYKTTGLSIHEQLEDIRRQLAEIAEDLESNERDHDTLFNSIAEISLKLQLNQTNPSRVRVKGFKK